MSRQGVERDMTARDVLMERSSHWEQDSNQEIAAICQLIAHHALGHLDGTVGGDKLPAMRLRQICAFIEARAVQIHGLKFEDKTLLYALIGEIVVSRIRGLELDARVRKLEQGNGKRQVRRADAANFHMPHR